MFEITNDNGKFIYPGKKTYVGFIELEITNNIYFNIDSKEHSFDIQEKYKLKITSKYDNYISKSKKLRIETSPFETSEAAKHAINSYFNSLRIILLKNHFSYRTPLTTKLEESPDPRCCVGTVEIELQNNERLKINDKERFHNENDLWYRLYSKQGLPICESDVLCVESSAYKEPEEAEQALDKIYPKLELFFACNPISPKTVLINESISFQESFGISECLTLSKRVPFNRELLKANSVDTFLNSVLALLEYKGFQDLPNLYNILELIEKDMGGKNQSKNRDIIEAKGLAKKDDIEKFTYSVNSVDVIGLEHVRHGAKHNNGNPTPKKALTIEGCRSVMNGLIDKWLDYKIKSQEIL